MMRYFPIVLRSCRAPTSLGFAAVFGATGDRSVEESQGFLFLFFLSFFLSLSPGGRRREGGGVKSHLEARDGAEFHEQHLEFRLHHVGRAPGEEVGGWSFSLVRFKWRVLPISLYQCFLTVIYVSGLSRNPNLLKKVGPVNLLRLLDRWLSRKHELQTHSAGDRPCADTPTPPSYCPLQRTL